ADAGRHFATYAVVAGDPLAEVAAEWHRMWSIGSTGNSFEERAGEAIAAWRNGRLEMPDYYVVVLDEALGHEQTSGAEPHRHDFHLGILRSERPSRVAQVMAGEPSETAVRTLHTLGQLRQGPWWPSLDRLIDSVRSFFPGRIGREVGVRSL
ncbi:MAG: hypothetical protein M3164_03915, partial [Actinomycetota bacterium]|nr:hypothetical protein [Actinomycetota bacterium]